MPQDKNVISSIYSNKDGSPYYFIGNNSLLKESPVAVFCSREIPLSIYHTANETFTGILRLPIVIGGGWQSAMEKRALKNYNKDSQAKIICFPAKGIYNFKIAAHLSYIRDSGRLLIVSPFLNKPRIDKKLVAVRDDLIFNLVDRFLFLYIKPNGLLESLFRRCLSDSKEVYLLEHKANIEYFVDRVKPFSSKNLKGLFI